MRRKTHGVVVPREILQATFDSAITSMDFGSGFLDQEEVEALRSVAVLLGVDPILATPANHVCLYRGEHEWYGPKSLCALRNGPVDETCALCHATRPLQTKPTEEHHWEPLGYQTDRQKCWGCRTVRSTLARGEDISGLVDAMREDNPLVGTTIPDLTMYRE